VSGFDALVIGEALAAKYASGTLTPPTGYPAVRVSTAKLPNNIPVTPWVLVVLPDGEVQIDSSQQVTLNYHVIFHYGKSSGDTARDMSGMMSWIGLLLAATFSGTTLGVSATQFVKSALPSTFRLTVETYGGDEYYGWDITVTVILRDLGWTMTP